MPFSASMYMLVYTVYTIICIHEQGTAPGDQLMTWHADYPE